MDNNYDTIHDFSYATGHYGKRLYETLNDAKAAAKRLRKTKGPKVRPYKCKFGGHYHIGHLKSAKDIDRIRRKSGIIKSNEQATSRPEETRKTTEESETL